MTSDCVHSFGHSFVSQIFHIAVSTIVVVSPPLSSSEGMFSTLRDLPTVRLFTASSTSTGRFSTSFVEPRSGELRTQKLRSHLVRTQSLNVLPLKPGVGQYIAINATLTARDFFLVYFYPSGPFTCIFPNPLPIFPFLCRLAE